MIDSLYHFDLTYINFQNFWKNSINKGIGIDDNVMKLNPFAIYRYISCCLIKMRIEQ